MEKLCEYDGEFHEIPNPYFRDPADQEKSLKDVQKRDQIKTNYREKKGIPLIRIKYTEFDRIEEILEKELASFIQTMV